MRRLQPRIEHWVTHYVDQVIEAGACELAASIVCPVPAAVILELLGFPEDDWSRVSWAFHAGAAYAQGTPEAATVGPDLAWVSARVAAELADRRRAPRADGLSYIANALVDGVTISEGDSEAFVLLVIGGGVDTTTSVTSAALVHLARHLDDRRRLVEQPDLLEHATEEFLRIYPPARTHARTVTHDVEFAGCQFARGDRVLISELSACHDERAFPAADQFVIDRFPNRHVAFGLGIHRCPGSHLARAQFKEIIRQVPARMPDYTVDEAGIVEYPNWSVIGGWSRIPATFTPGPGSRTERRRSCASTSTSTVAPGTPCVRATPRRLRPRRSRLQPDGTDRDCARIVGPGPARRAVVPGAGNIHRGTCARRRWREAVRRSGVRGTNRA